MKEMIKRTAACLLFAGLAAGMLYGAYRLLHFKSTDGCYPAGDVLSAGGEYR